MMNPGIHAAINAANEAERRKREREEERMTRYSKDELDQDWEFKIVRSSTGAFRNPELFQQVVDEEALSGWRLLEKLDNNRLRFKRPANASRRDAMLPEGVDPYRTEIGTNSAAVALVVMGVVLMLGFGIAFLVFFEEGGGDIGEIPWVAVALVGGLVTVMGAVVAAARMNR